MKGGKDEGRGMDPLFPRLHISEADKGGPRAPPRNKIALCEQYNVACQGPKFRCGSMSSLPGNACGGLPSQPSSSNVSPGLCSIDALLLIYIAFIYSV